LYQSILINLAFPSICNPCAWDGKPSMVAPSRVGCSRRSPPCNLRSIPLNSGNKRSSFGTRSCPGNYNSL